MFDFTQRDKYQKLEDKKLPQKQYSFLQVIKQPKRKADQLSFEIQTNLERMKLICKNYAKEILSKNQKQSYAEFERLQNSNAKSIDNFKKYVQDMKQLSKNKKDISKVKMQSTEIKKYQTKLKIYIENQISYITSIKKQITQKKQNLQNSLPQGKSLEELMLGNASVKVKNAVEDLQEKIHEIKILAKSISECNQLLKQIEFLVDEELIKIDIVQGNLNRANEDLEEADNLLQIKINEKRSWMKWVCIIIIVLGIVAAILLFLFFKHLI